MVDNRKIAEERQDRHEKDNERLKQQYSRQL